MYTLFLPGSFRRSEDYRWLTGHLSQICDYYTVNYPLTSSVAKINSELYNFDSMLDIRREIVYGSSSVLDSQLEIKDDDSILGSFLNQVNRKLGRSECIDNILSQTLIIGHSQGAGHAALISLEFNLRGLLLIAGPSDSYQGVPSRWTKLKGKTSPQHCKMYVHAEDRHARLCLYHAMELGLKNTCILTDSTDLEEVVLSQIVIDVRSMPPLKSHEGITFSSATLDEFNKAYLTALVTYYNATSATGGFPLGSVIS